MKEVTLGYIYTSSKPSVEDKLFLEVAKEKKIKLVLFNVSKEISEKETEEKIRLCDLVFNNTAGYLALELVKNIEELGKKVIDSSKTFYYTEDKWMFFLKCLEHNIPTPESILLSSNVVSARKELEKFNKWPVILKRISGEQGEFVQKADNIKEALFLIKEFWRKGIERLPIIAQEMIKSKTYRVTVIDGKIVQNVLKDGHGWKATSVYAKKVERFPVDKALEKLVKKISQLCNIKICGIDFMKKDNKWLVLEVNAEPSFEFFEEEHEKIISKVLDFLKKEALKPKERR